MPKYKIGDIVVELNLKYPDKAYWYEPYLYSGGQPAEFSLTADDKDIDYFVREGVDITPPVAENMVLCTCFNRKLLKYYGNYIHSSAMLFDGRVYLFSASSGVGKSTHTAKWKARFGDRVTIINDDKPSFRIIDKKCYIYGTPFAGGTDTQVNLSAELGGIVFVERSDTNSLEKINPSRAVGLLIAQAPTYRNAKLVDRQLELFSQILSDYPAYILKCNLDDSAVDAALSIIIN